MPLKYLRFTSVGPFDEVEFEFDKQVNVFVGPNNCGKSVTLMVLADISVYPFSFPVKYVRGENPTFETKFSVGKRTEKFSGILPVNWDSYDKAEGKTHVSFLKKLGYTTFVPALRESTDFRAEGPGPRRKTEKEREVKGWTLSGTSGTTKTTISPSTGAYWYDMGSENIIWASGDHFVQSSSDELIRRYGLINTGAMLVKDETVIQKIIDMDYMAYRRKDKFIWRIIEDIAKIASDITDGFPIKFSGVGEDELGLFPKFITPEGEIALNCLSQGTQSIMQWLAHLLIGYAEYYKYPRNLKELTGILIIDEIDAHLHPSWQKRIIPSLTKHFPNLQIFFSTHSPLMLAGLRAGQVHLMTRESPGKVSVTQNERDIIGWSADEILRGFMDVSSPTDLATTQKVERLQELRSRKKLSIKQKAELDKLREDIHVSFLEGSVEAKLGELKTLLRDRKKKKTSTPKGKTSSRKSKAKSGAN